MRIQINRAVSESIELTIQDSHEVVVRIGHDAFRGTIPKHRNRHAAPIIRSRGVISFSQKLKAIDGVEGMSRTFAKGPTSFVTNGIHDGHADHGFQLLELTNDDRTMGPGTGP